MNQINDGGPAFPLATGWVEEPQDGRPNPKMTVTVRELARGLSLRDYFAAKAMQGNIAGWPADQLFNPEGIAGHAYETADAMLKARNQ